MSLKKLRKTILYLGKIIVKKVKNFPFMGEFSLWVELMRQKALGRKHSEDTKLIMSSKLRLRDGSLVNVFERCDKEGFKLIGSFVSARRAGKFLDISGSTVVRYMKSGEIFKYKYKFVPQ